MHIMPKTTIGLQGSMAAMIARSAIIQNPPTQKLPCTSHPMTSMLHIQKRNHDGGFASLALNKTSWSYDRKPIIQALKTKIWTFV